MSGDVTMQMVIEAIGELYQDDGIAIWLAAEHSSGRFAGRRPIEICKTADGRFEVWSYVQILTDTGGLGL